jgi:hypothetical protein
MSFCAILLDRRGILSTDFLIPISGKEPGSTRLPGPISLYVSRDQEDLPENRVALAPLVLSFIPLKRVLRPRDSEL